MSFLKIQKQKLIKFLRKKLIKYITLKSLMLISLSSLLFMYVFITSFIDIKTYPTIFSTIVFVKIFFYILIPFLSCSIIFLCIYYRDNWSGENKTKQLLMELSGRVVENEKYIISLVKNNNSLHWHNTLNYLDRSLVYYIGKNRDEALNVALVIYEEFLAIGFDDDYITKSMPSYGPELKTAFYNKKQIEHKTKILNDLTLI